MGDVGILLSFIESLAEAKQIEHQWYAMPWADAEASEMKDTLLAFMAFTD